MKVDDNLVLVELLLFAMLWVTGFHSPSGYTNFTTVSEFIEIIVECRYNQLDFSTKELLILNAFRKVRNGTMVFPIASYIIPSFIVRCKLNYSGMFWKIPFEMPTNSIWKLTIYRRRFYNYINTYTFIHY